MLTRYDPFREIGRLADAVTRSAAHAMPMDALRADGALVVYVDLPGVDPDAIEVSAERNLLTISAERPAADDGELVLSERPHGRIRRELVLGESLDTDRLEADYRDGVLCIRVPQRTGGGARRVSVSRGARTGTTRAVGDGGEPSRGAGSGGTGQTGGAGSASSSTAAPGSGTDTGTMDRAPAEGGDEEVTSR